MSLFINLPSTTNTSVGNISENPLLSEKRQNNSNSNFGTYNPFNLNYSNDSVKNNIKTCTNKNDNNLFNFWNNNNENSNLFQPQSKSPKFQEFSNNSNIGNSGGLFSNSNKTVNLFDKNQILMLF